MAVTKLAFSRRGAELSTQMANMSAYSIKPNPQDITTFARHVQSDLKILLKIGQTALAHISPDGLREITTGLETDAYHVRDILVGLSAGLDNIMESERTSPVEIPLRDLVAFTREQKGPLQRKDHLARAAKDLFAFYCLKQKLIELAAKGQLLT
ncbi:MAG: hypothetical protein PHH60_05710, partial [Candidatus Margulisbacteria bacterium]|nr:hypothetical protein [Candidatus Margulisiibacteriota bacterium]